MTAVCCWLIRRLASLVDRSQREWLDALLAELDAVPGGRRRLLWALDGLRLGLLLVPRSLFRARGRRTPAGWWRHPGLSLALLLGAPAPALGRRQPAVGGTRAYLTALACACTAGLAVLVLRGLVEDSPYPFNAGHGAPPGIHPDWANPMSLAFDLVVFASAAELLAVLVLTVLFVRLAARADRPVPGPVRAALVASAFPLWMLVGATLLLGVAAHQSAAGTFDHGPAGGTYLTWASWVALVVVMAVSATVTTAAGLGLGRGRRRSREYSPAREGSDK